MKNITICFTGESNSGKTTLIEILVTKLSPDFRVVVIKHDPKDKAVFDTEGKDSYKFTKAGADTVVVSPKKTTYLKKETTTIEDIKKMVGEFDYLFIEGLKILDERRIGIFRDKIDESYFNYIDAVAINGTINKKEIPKDLKILDLDNTNEILEWINDYS